MGGIREPAGDGIILESIGHRRRKVWDREPFSVQSFGNYHEKTYERKKSAT